MFAPCKKSRVSVLLIIFVYEKKIRFFQNFILYFVFDCESFRLFTDTKNQFKFPYYCTTITNSFKFDEVRGNSCR